MKFSHNRPGETHQGGLALSRAPGWRCAASLLMLVAAFSAQASFHLWSINELYSNADGSVQFIELKETAGFPSQNLLGGHVITCSGPLGTNRFTFPNDLPSTATAGKTFLIGTTNLASTPGGLVPDYVFTNNMRFLLSGSGTVNFADVDVVTYTNLPKDGVASLVRSGSAMVFSATNSPKNFVSQSNSIVPVRFSSLVGTGANVVISFRTASGVNGAAGPNYAVQTNGDFNMVNWATFTNVTGNGSVRSISVPLEASPRFFRLRVP